MGLGRFGFLIVFLGIASLAVLSIWRWSYADALKQLENRGSASLSLASDRLVGLLERYRILPVALANDDIFVNALNQGTAGQELQQRLQTLADMTGAQSISLADADGRIVANSVRFESRAATSETIKTRPDFRRAMNGALGIYHAQENPDAPRGFLFASAVRDNIGTPIGALVINADLETLEFHWRGDPEIIFFTDKNNVIFISNRDSLILRVLQNPSDSQLQNLYDTRYASEDLAALPNPTATTRHGQTIWHLADISGIPNPALFIEQPLPVIGMSANILLDLSPALAQARLRTLIAAMGVAIFGLILWTLQIRRQALARQLLIREQANARLEERVENRTAQLTDANRSLQQAQDDLVQAGKLAALGEMSAGISHELNQPLAAIQSFSENAGVFLDRGNIDQTKSNIQRITDLTSRMARIIKNLRDFSRKEGEAAIDVRLNAVVNDALEIASVRLNSDNVSIDWQQPASDIMVKGGPVRLQQVVLNLLSNAMDAMEGQSDKRITISIEQSDNQTRLLLRDNGPGLETPEKIFDPFYTTKSVDHPQGMGLGLSISYGIVQSFGGNISGHNHAKGGAVIVVTLDPVTQKGPDQ